MAVFRHIAASDRPVVWAVGGLLVLGAGLNVPIFLLPRLAQSLKGETLYTLFVLSGIAVVSGIAMLCVGLLIGWLATRNARVGSIRTYFRALRIPVVIVLGTVVLGYVLSAEGWSLWITEGIRVFAAGLAGWLVARYGFSLWKCAIAGVLLLVLDHVVVKTVAFAIALEWVAIGGVFVSFGMFASLPMAIAAAVGCAAKRMPPSNNTVETDAHEAARGSP